MKKWLSILGTIGLTATSTTSLIACNKPDNNKNGGENKPETTPEPEKPQQPPKNSNWKLVNDIKNEFNNYNDKWYLVIAKNTTYKFIKIIKFKNNQNDKAISPITNNTFYIYPVYNEWYSIINLYYWDGNNEPNLPEINFNTGKITDWKE